MRVTSLKSALLLVTAIGMFNASPASAVQVLCEVSGETNQQIVCPFYMVRESQSVSLPVAMQATIKYTESLDLKHFSDGEFCGATVCVPYQIPTPFTVLQSGHTLTPSLLSGFMVEPGTGFVGPTLRPNESPTTAYYQGQTLVGDPKVFSMHFYPQQPVAADQPILVTLDTIIVSNANGQPMTANVVGYPGIVVLGDPPVTCNNIGESCDDNNVCTLDDECIAGVCYGPSVDCDDGDPCTDDWCDPVDGCQHSTRTACALCPDWTETPTTARFGLLEARAPWQNPVLSNSI